MQHGEFPPVRQLEGNDVAATNAKRGEPRRQYVGAAADLGIAETHFRSGLRTRRDDRGLVRRAGEGAAEMVEQGLVAPMSGGRHGGAAFA